MQVVRARAPMLTLIGCVIAVTYATNANASSPTRPNTQLLDFLATHNFPKNVFSFPNIRNGTVDRNDKTSKEQSTRARSKKSSQALNLFQASIRSVASQSGNVSQLLHCDSRVVWRDLGPLHYPRFLKEVHCLRRRRTCMTGYFMCVPVFYDVAVLAEKTEDDQVDTTIPLSLRIQWTFTTVQTSVGCLCGVH